MLMCVVALPVPEPNEGAVTIAFETAVLEKNSELWTQVGRKPSGLQGACFPAVLPLMTTIHECMRIRHLIRVRHLP